MSQVRDLDLYELLPAVYRIRDVERNQQLRALLEVVSEQAHIVKDNIDDLWADYFIETCAPWVVPYIGDLVGNLPIHEISIGRRADVAHTIFYRRRKGTLAMLGQLARDVTGWGATAVAFFELLGWTQNLNHLRFSRWQRPSDQIDPPQLMDRVGWVNLRHLDVLDRIDGAFDVSAHTVDVRPVSSLEGWHGIKKVGFFVWRLFSYPMTGVPARRVGADNYRFTFSQLGHPMHLFTRWEPVAPYPGTATEMNVPAPIRPTGFYERIADYYGPAKSIDVFVNGVAVPPAQVMCKRLDGWNAPPANMLAIDVALGRLMLGTGLVPGAPPATITVDYSHGFSADMGGGPYTRDQRRFAPPLATGERDTVTFPIGTDTDLIPVPGVHNGNPINTLSDAVAEWKPNLHPLTVVQIQNSATYATPAAGLKITSATPAAGSRLVLQAADRQRPVVSGNISVEDTQLFRFTLDGVVLAGALNLTNSVAEVFIRHSTLVPGITLKADGSANKPAQPSITADAATPSRLVCVYRSIIGPPWLPAEGHTLLISDSIVDAPDQTTGRVPAIAADGNATSGPPLKIERATVLGNVRTTDLILASECVFAEGDVRSDRLQDGCVRFSVLDTTTSRTPRRFRCQPDLALVGVDSAHEAAVRQAMRPVFTTETYGRAAYCQLSDSCAPEIRTGSEDGSEMGAFRLLEQPQREANLRLRLDEYLPFGLEAGVIHVT